MELILVASDLDRKIRIKVETKGGKTKTSGSGQSRRVGSEENFK